MNDTVKQKNKLTKKSKAIISVSVIAAALIVVGVLFVILTGKSGYKLYNKMALSLMPETLTSENGNVTFRVKENPNYNPEKNPGDSQFTYYLEGKDGKLVELTGGVYVNGKGEKSLVSVGFFTKAIEKLNKIKKIVKTVIFLLALVILAVLIYVWYKSWCKREEKQKQLLYSNKK